jgi:hypothetical protein
VGARLRDAEGEGDEVRELVGDAVGDRVTAESEGVGDAESEDVPTGPARAARAP